jgi:hypothetical protein
VKSKKQKAFLTSSFNKSAAANLNEADVILNAINMVDSTNNHQTHSKFVFANLLVSNRRFHCLL